MIDALVTCWCNLCFIAQAYNDVHMPVEPHPIPIALFIAWAPMSNNCRPAQTTLYCCENSHSTKASAAIQCELCHSFCQGHRWVNTATTKSFNSINCTIAQSLYFAFSSLWAVFPYGLQIIYPPFTTLTTNVSSTGSIEEERKPHVCHNYLLSTAAFTSDNHTNDEVLRVSTSSQDSSGTYIRPEKRHEDHW